MSKLKTKLISLLRGNVPKKVNNNFQHDFSEEEKEIFSGVKPYTMTSPERIISLLRATDYIVKNNIGGDIVECGVWKGGSIMAVLKKLISLGSIDRKIWLCDTFEGMSAPTEFDKEGNFTGRKCKRLFIFLLPFYKIY